MEDKYIKVAAIYKKLKIAETEHRPIYISGALAFGKTAAVNHYYHRTKVCRLSGVAGYLDQQPELETIEESVIFIDDITWITDEASKDYIVELIKRGTDKHFVLVGRGQLPSYLRIIAVEQDFVMASEKDLALCMEDIRKLLKMRNCECSDEELKIVREATEGQALAVIYFANRLNEGMPFGEEAISCTRLDLRHYYEHDFWMRWNSDMKNVFLAMCQYDNFTIEMAELVTGNNRIAVLMEQAIQVGNFLTKINENDYEFRTELRKFLRWKQSLEWTKEQIAENFHRAALYYELQDEVVKALECYKASGNKQQIPALLIKNAKKHSGYAHFFEMRQYYYELSEETVKRSPVLMSGMSMLYSITLQPDLSDKWYEELVTYEKGAKRRSYEKEEAREQLAYLDIALPHRGIKGIAKILKTTAILLANKEIELPEISVTSNIPSVINGAKDFCEWSRNDKELAKILKKPLELVLGKYGIGLVNIALAESGMENGRMSSYDIITRANTGYMMSDTGGKIEMCFVATGILIREHLSQGQMSQAESTLARFRHKVVKEGASHLLPNIDAMNMWLKLLKGDTRAAKAWILTAPDEVQDFCVLDRYQYMQKVRCLIVLNKLAEALNLMEKLNVYYVQYERHYMWMENQILRAILFYRMKNDIWIEVLTKALQKAEPYHFARIFAKEGIALKPLLDDYQIEKLPVAEKFYREIVELTNQTAVYYPKYLEVEKVLETPLTATERKVLKLMCNGLSTEQICDLCCFSESSLKQHRWSIFKKLDVKNRGQAEKEAVRLGLNE